MQLINVYCYFIEHKRDDLYFYKNNYRIMSEQEAGNSLLNASFVASFKNKMDAVNFCNEMNKKQINSIPEQEEYNERNN